jgi:Tol biopolymer transport system component
MHLRRVSAALAALAGLLVSSNARALPDLTEEIQNVSIQLGATVGAGDVAEGCASSTSGVDLLRFGVRTRNAGTTDFVLGDPQCMLPCTDHPDEPCGNPDFICSPADGHNHAHYANFLRYELLDGTDTVVVTGRKESFCLRDTECGAPVYTCAYQGITAGCSDTYGASLGCQYLEVTAVPPGNYVLRVTVDPLNRVVEDDEGNNVTTIAVTIPLRSAGATTTTTLPRPTTTSTLAPGETTSTTVPGVTTSTLASTTTSTVTSTTSPPSDTPTTTVPPPLGVTTRASVASDGTQADTASIHPALSAEGRFVAFESRATTLVAGDAARLSDVFVHDRASGATERVSLAADGTDARGGSERPRLSADGRFVVFTSNAANLVAGDTNRATDVFVRDRVAGTTVRASVASDGAEGNDDSFDGVLSADGHVVVFATSATNLVPGDANGVDIVVRDLANGTTTQASVASDGTRADGESVNPAVSADGRFVAFESQATNLVPGDTNGVGDVFVHDRATGATTRVSIAADGSQSDGESFRPVISADGSIVVFESRADNLIAGDSNAAADVFLHDRATGATSRVSVASDGTGGDRTSYLAGVSGDGRLVAFTSEATNLVPGDTNGMPDVFVHDRATGMTARASLSSDGAEADGSSHGQALSLDGAIVAFESEATNLVPGDTNGVTDVFTRERVTPRLGCTTDAECDPAPSCSTSRCGDGSCSVVAVGGIEGVLCRLHLDRGVCGGEALPGGLTRFTDRMLTKVRDRLLRLEAQPPKPTRLVRILRRLDGQLGRIDRRAARAARHARFSLACRSALAQWIGEMRVAVAVLPF